MAKYNNLNGTQQLRLQGETLLADADAAAVKAFVPEVYRRSSSMSQLFNSELLASFLKQNSS